jgi:hypothetical protein
MKKVGKWRKMSRIVVEEEGSIIEVELEEQNDRGRGKRNSRGEMRAE